MAPLVIAALVGAGMGLMQSEEQKKAFKEQQKVEAIKERWSAFTKDRGQNLQRPNSMAPVMQGAMTGAMFGQQFSQGQQQTNPYAKGMSNVSQTSSPMSGQTYQQQEDWRNPGAQRNMYA